MATDRIYGKFQFAGVKVATAAKSQVNSSGTDGYAPLVANVGTDGLTLASDSNPVPVSGSVGSYETLIQTAQTVTASSAYASGNCVGGLITLTNIARTAAGSGMILSAVVNSKSAQTAPIDVIFFNANPSGSTITDKTAIAVAAADFDKVLGVAHVTDWTSLGTPSVGQAQNVAIPFIVPSGRTIYAALVTRGTPTFTATTDISVGIRALQN